MFGKLTNVQRTWQKVMRHKILDLSGVTLVEVEVVRFLIRGDEEGIEIAHSPAYVREWMQRERAEGGQVGSSDPA